MAGSIAHAPPTDGIEAACRVPAAARQGTLPASIRAGGYVRGSINYTDGNGLLTEVYTAPISPLAAATYGVTISKQAVAVMESGAGNTETYMVVLKVPRG